MNIKPLIPLTVMVLGTLLCAPAPGFAQSILLTASNYALLGGTAISVGGPGPNAITNGNVGLWTGATSNITGFPPATVTGTTRSGSAAAIIATGALTTGQAMADLQRAHTGLAGMPSNVNLSNVDLGTVAPLSAGVYTFNGAAALTGALVLDAQGQNNVAWVFQIGTSLTTAANSTVTFINLGSNGGNDLGLFWNAGAGITIGDNNTTAGNYIAGTSISFTGITTVLGTGGTRALALAAVSFAGPGAINALGGGGREGGLMYDSNGNVVPIPPPIAPPVTPPIVLPPVVLPPAVVPPIVAPPVVVPGGLVAPPVVPGTAYTGSVLLSSTGAYTPGVSGVILVPGTPYPTSSMTVDGISLNGSAASSLTITTATVALSGVNTYTGGTNVNGAVLIASSANLPANRNILLTNGGSLIFNQPVNGAFGGVTSGAGSVTKLGAGTLTYLGANTYTGGTYVSGGVLVASTATLPANQNITISSGSAMIFDQAADGTFGGSILGAGVVQKKGAGALTLTNATTAPIDLQAGALLFNGGLGTTTIAAGALLGGNGTIAGNLTNSGTLSPGASPGTINVSGNYTQTSTGTLIIELASGASFDQLVISGTATLAGGVQINLLGGFDPVGKSFTFLTAAGGVNGTFGIVTGNALATGRAAVASSLIYSATGVTFAYVQLPFAGFALTPNQRAVANAASASSALTTALNVVPAASQFPAAFNTLSPQGYEVWSDIAFAHATALTDRLMRDHGAIPGHDNYYFDASQRRARTRGDLDVGSSTFTSTSGLVGVDHVVDSTVTAGGFFNYGETVAGLGRPGSRTSVKDKMLGVRAAWTRDAWFAHGVYAYGWDKYNSTRPVVFPGTSVIATSNTNGHQWLADLSLGRHLTSGGLTVSPFAGVLVSGWRANGFTESGAGVFNNRLGNQSARSLRTQAGLEGQLNWEFGSVTLQPHVRAAWLREFSNGARSMRAAFDSVPYTVVTREPQRDSALFSAGLDVLLNPRALLYTDFTAQSGGIIKYLSDWRVGVSVRF